MLCLMIAEPGLLLMTKFIAKVDCEWAVISHIQFRTSQNSFNVSSYAEKL